MRAEDTNTLQKSDAPAEANSGTKRSAPPRICLLVDALHYDFQWTIAFGFLDAAAERGASACVVCGGTLQPGQGQLKLRTQVITEIDPANLDGLAVLTAAIAWHGDTELSDLIDAFGGRPVVSIGEDLHNAATLSVDNYSSFRALAQHLVGHHGYRRIAMVAGPTANVESQLRVKAVTDVLGEHQLALPRSAVFHGDFTQVFGAIACRTLLDERGFGPHNLDAIICANDHMAIGVLAELRRRGIEVPGEIALVGFDDMQFARHQEPPLTTVRQPLGDIGRRAADMLLDALAGSGITSAMLEPRLVVRQSCGCLADSELPPPPSSKSGAQHGPEASLAVLAEPPIQRRATQLAQLLQAPADELEAELERLVRWEAGDAARWMRALEWLTEKEASTNSPVKNAMSLSRARLKLVSISEREHARRHVTLSQRGTALAEAAGDLLSTLHAEGVVSAATRHLPLLGVPLALIARTMASAQGMLCNPLLLHDEAMVRPLPGAFPVGRLILEELWSARPRGCLVIPLCSQTRLEGLAIFESGPKEGPLYEQLASLFASALTAVFDA